MKRALGCLPRLILLAVVLFVSFSLAIWLAG
jgi:hypothetical protein